MDGAYANRWFLYHISTPASEIPRYLDNSNRSELSVTLILDVFPLICRASFDLYSTAWPILKIGTQSKRKVLVTGYLISNTIMDIGKSPYMKIQSH